jgi:hypothetical protein
MYPSTAELVAASSVAELTGLEEAQQDALREEAILAVEAHCKQSFEQEGKPGELVERIIDGSGADTIYLPKRLVELDTLSVVGGSLLTDDVALSEKRDRLHVIREGDGGTWATRAVAAIEGRQPTTGFPAGPGAVTISGVWGWADDELPAAVKTALRLDMEDRALAGSNALAESMRSARALGSKRVQQGGLSVDLSGGEPAVSNRVERVLSTAGLVWESAVGALA